MPGKILLINASDVLPDAAVSAILPALQLWDDTMLAPAYGLGKCVYSFQPRTVALMTPQAYEDAGIWPLLINRHSTDDGVLGFHDDQAGLTFGRVFAGDALRYGVEWTVTLSHEAGETRVDPQLNAFVTLPDGRQLLKEVGDPVESDDQAIEVNGVKLSNFALPSYWDQGPGPWDYQGKLTGPAPTLTPGGYLSIYNGSAWTQITAMMLGGPPSWRSQWAHRSHRRPRQVRP